MLYISLWWSEITAQSDCDAVFYSVSLYSSLWSIMRSDKLLYRLVSLALIICYSNWNWLRPFLRLKRMSLLSPLGLAMLWLTMLRLSILCVWILIWICFNLLQFWFTKLHLIKRIWYTRIQALHSIIYSIIHSIIKAS